MKNQAEWKESKFLFRNGRLRASRDPGQVGPGSRLIADLVANLYQTHLPRHAKGRLLDLGCGTVPLYSAYKDLVSGNICVDWANTLHKNVHLDLECDLTKPLPFANGEFDTILLSDVLEHIPNPDDLWLEISRVLSADGKIILNVPFFYWLHEQPNDYYRYTEFALRRFVGNSGLELVDLLPVGGAPEIMADIFAKNVVRAPVVGPPLALMSQALAYWFVRTGAGRRISRSTARTFPLGYFLVARKPGHPSPP